MRPAIRLCHGCIKNQNKYSMFKKPDLPVLLYRKKLLCLSTGTAPAQSLLRNVAVLLRAVWFPSPLWQRGKSPYAASWQSHNLLKTCQVAQSFSLYFIDINSGFNVQQSQKTQKTFAGANQKTIVLSGGFWYRFHLPLKAVKGALVLFLVRILLLTTEDESMMSCLRTHLRR